MKRMRRWRHRSTVTPNTYFYFFRIFRYVTTLRYQKEVLVRRVGMLEMQLIWKYKRTRISIWGTDWMFCKVAFLLPKLLTVAFLDGQLQIFCLWMLHLPDRALDRDACLRLYLTRFIIVTEDRNGITIAMYCYVPFGCNSSFTVKCLLDLHDTR